MKSPLIISPEPFYHNYFGTGWRGVNRGQSVSWIIRLRCARVINRVIVILVVIVAQKSVRVTYFMYNGRSGINIIAIVTDHKSRLTARVCSLVWFP